MSIQQIVNETNKTIHKLHEEGALTKQILAVGIEINQRYSEYLEALETADFQIQTGVTVEVNGQRVHFKNNDDFAAWVAENMT